MKHIGETLKKHIEENHLKKGNIAETAGISYNYLSTIFKQHSCDADLLERLYVAAGLNPAVVFDVPSHIANTEPADYTTKVALQKSNEEHLQKLLEEKERIIAEKERVIQLLMSQQRIS